MSLINLQNKIGVKADGVFGPGTFKKASEFLKLTPQRAVHFFAQTAHETGDFKIFTENLNYSSDGLQKIFKKYFPDSATAERYARKPEMIANKVYGDRMGNGPESSGDGWKYRGRGALQLTGKDNYTEFSKHQNRPDIITNPDIVATELAFESAMFFFDKNKLWSICDQGFGEVTVVLLTKKINGGTNGLDHRLSLTKLYASWI